MPHEPGLIFFFFSFLLPQSCEELERRRELRAHTFPSMPACALPSNLTCLLLRNSWKNVKLSSVIKVGFSKGFKNISEFQTFFLSLKINPSSIPLTDASWNLFSQLVLFSGFPWWRREGLVFPVQFQVGLLGCFNQPRCTRAHAWAPSSPRIHATLKCNYGGPIHLPCTPSRLLRNGPVPCPPLCAREIIPSSGLSACSKVS